MPKYSDRESNLKAVVTRNDFELPNKRSRKAGVIDRTHEVVVVGGASTLALARKLAAETTCHSTACIEGLTTKLKPIPKFNTILHWDAVVSPPSANELKELREHSELTQSGLAALLGLSNRQLVSDYERGLKHPNSQTYTLWLLLTGQHPTLQVVNKPILPRTSFMKAVINDDSKQT